MTTYINPTWLVTIDGYDLNDGIAWVFVSCPQVNDVAPTDLTIVELQDDYPVLVHTNPTSGRFTINLAMAQPCSDADWSTRMAALKANLGPGLHALALQVRGATALGTVQVAYLSMATDFRNRLVSLEFLAPTPVLV